LCSAGVPEYHTPLRLLAAPRLELRSSLISTPTAGWLQGDVCVRCCPPFRLRVAHYLTHTCPLDTTRSPWVTSVSSPPCRPHPPWYAGGEPQRLRLHSAGSTIPQLGPTGSSLRWLPLSTTRWFSANPSDLPSRGAPCPPKDSKRWLQVRLGCLQLSPSCPGRLLHTFLSFRPVRRYPHFGISARGRGPSGTLTRLRHTLPGTHYA
jgi:hypothetical protein